MKKLFVLGVISFLFLHCHKEKMGEVCIPLREQAAKFPPAGPSFDQHVYYTTISNGQGIHHMDFNPNNPDEILFRGLTRYNLKTGERKVLPKGDLLLASRPRWSKKDWIIFSAQSGPPAWDIYKIKSNGDSLTQLTYMGNCHDPEWNLAGDRFGCYLGLTSPTISLLFDEYGNVLDSINGFGGGSWRHDSLYTNTGPSRLFVNDPTNDTTIFFLPFENLNFSFNGGAEWVNGENIIWSNIEGVFKTNINSGQTIQIKESCNSVTYRCPAYSFISGKVIFIRTVKEITGPSSGTAKTSLVMMNADDGSEEEVIDLE